MKKIEIVDCPGLSDLLNTVLQRISSHPRRAEKLQSVLTPEKCDLVIHEIFNVFPRCVEFQLAVLCFGLIDYENRWSYERFGDEYGLSEREVLKIEHNCLVAILNFLDV